jgi:hypothetical protein
MSGELIPSGSILSNDSPGHTAIRSPKTAWGLKQRQPLPASPNSEPLDSGAVAGGSSTKPVFISGLWEKRCGCLQLDYTWLMELPELLSSYFSKASRACRRVAARPEVFK